MEEEISKAINSSVFQEYGKSEYSSVTKAVDFAQKHVSVACDHSI